MIDYSLKNKVALITGANNPWGIGAATALAFAREGAKVVLVYKRVDRPFDPSKTDRNGVDRYYGANAGDASAVENGFVRWARTISFWKAIFHARMQSRISTQA